MRRVHTVTRDVNAGAIAAPESAAGRAEYIPPGDRGRASGRGAVHASTIRIGAALEGPFRPRVVGVDWLRVLAVLVGDVRRADIRRDRR